MGPRKATNKTAASTPSKKAAATKATKNTPSKARSSSKVPVENRSPDAEKSTSAEVKSPEVLKETNTVGEEEKEVLKDADEKPSVGEGLEDENVAEDSRAEISGGKVEDAAAVAEVKMEEQSAGDFEEKAAEKYQEEEKQSVENLDENVDQNADTKSAEDEDKEDAGNEAEVADANAVDEYSELQNSVLTSERRKSKKLEVFVGGLDKEATEDDLRQIFEKMGEITELRLMKDPQTGKNKGYAFVRYATPDEAKRAVQELAKVEIRGRKCGVSPLAEKDTVFIGNIDKNWTKDDVFNKLKELGSVFRLSRMTNEGLKHKRFRTIFHLVLFFALIFYIRIYVLVLDESTGIAKFSDEKSLGLVQVASLNHRSHDSGRNMALQWWKLFKEPV